MPGAARDDRDAQHPSGQVALALQKGAVHDGNYPERRVQVSDLGFKLSGLVKVPSIHVLVGVANAATHNVSMRRSVRVRE